MAPGRFATDLRQPGLDPASLGPAFELHKKQEALCLERSPLIGVRAPLRIALDQPF